jgi:hypothetical protein
MLCAELLREPLPPLVRVSRGVEDAKYDHCTVNEFIENYIRESTDERSAIVVMDDRVDLGLAAYCVNACIHTAEKIFSQADSLMLVPQA